MGNNLIHLFFFGFCFFDHKPMKTMEKQIKTHFLIKHVALYICILKYFDLNAGFFNPKAKKYETKWVFRLMENGQQMSIFDAPNKVSWYIGLEPLSPN